MFSGLFWWGSRKIRIPGKNGEVALDCFWNRLLLFFVFFCQEWLPQLLLDTSPEKPQKVRPASSLTPARSNSTVVDRH